MFIVSMRINAHDAYDWDCRRVVSLPLQTSCNGEWRLRLSIARASSALRSLCTSLAMSLVK